MTKVTAEVVRNIAQKGENILSNDKKTKNLIKFKEAFGVGSPIMHKKNFMKSFFIFISAVYTTTIFLIMLNEGNKIRKSKNKEKLKKESNEKAIKISIVSFIMVILIYCIKYLPNKTYSRSSLLLYFFIFSVNVTIYFLIPIFSLFKNNKHFINFISWLVLFILNISLLLVSDKKNIEN